MFLLIDEGVPNDVTDFLLQRGHEVALIRDHFLPGTQDDVLARWGHEHEAVFVTWYKHFRNKLIKRRPESGTEPFFRLGRISFHKCEESQGEHRIRQFMDIIEEEYRQSQDRTDKRIIVEIMHNRLAIWR